MSLYDDMVQNRMILAEQTELPAEYRIVDLEALRQQIYAQDHELQARSKQYGSLQANMSISMRDVQSHLGDGDIAIEFVSFAHNEDSVMYAALTLKKGYEAPRLVPLFEQKALSVIRPKTYYKTDRLYNLVWAPLADELQGIDRVYFAPTGQLHNINIEVLPLVVRQDDTRSYYRLSSTRELTRTYIDNVASADTAVIYGGLRYEVEDKGDQGAGLQTVGTLRLLSGWDYLPGTLDEAQSIAQALRKARVNTLLLTGVAGTEASLRAQSGTRRQLLHVATHGFYYSGEDVSAHHQDDHLAGRMQREQNRVEAEDKMLTRSGLLMAGCGPALHGQDVASGEDDGILYAHEIAQLRLEGVEHVTLSACETALGDISGEGVFGLQRAFKKAGVRSMLMSLWKVDDAATRLFMTRFYSNLYGQHMTKAQSLREAQRYLRLMPEYADPVYWAGFVLLDGLE